MNYKLLLYCFNIMLCLYAINCVNINAFFKTNKIIESRIFVMIISFILAYLLTNFIIDFIEISTII